MTNDDSWGGFPPPTAKPVYEIPVTPPGATAAGWTPGPGVPLAAPPTWGAPVDAVPAEPVAPAPVWPLDGTTTAAAPGYAPVEAVRLVPAGRRAAQPQEGTPEVVGAQIQGSAEPAPDELALLTPDERTALENADAELVAALREVVYRSASDLHVTAGSPPMVRIDGALTPAGASEPWSHDRTRSALFSLLTDRQRDMFSRELELDFAFTISANSRFRVNLYQQRGSVGAAFRLIPTEIKQLRDLGVPEQIARFAGLPRGLVLVTGPTGSGKSTTLAALIDLVNSTRADHIVTVEDPIEFMHKHKRAIVNQREVGHDTHSFNNALKHVLRQDPDVILIGELRDLETISVALTAAETGHLVFATLHTQDAAQTIDRVIDVFPPHQQDQVRAQLAGTLQGVVCQTLVKRASGRGRAVATEILMITPAIANLIREGKTYQIASMMQAGKDAGMHTMDQHLADLVNAGTITRAAAMEKAHDTEGIGRLIQRVDGAGGLGVPLASSGPDYGDTYSAGVR
ncbi:PilT/PilU family type 4a pilus ATPase [Leifsonia sp. 1010]|uniref:PilT/PilU family type 4a pilus ATPase n=1 Tax=Leifsonia sp. 1010 TaxID=2817769 RepID=UPI00285DC88E|nr:PilT/PilU family type 4a pilus ATPase [Leifsonia sp. 1010]MDR6610634.1 twitching motility protein PilT [Leifsonia sp. 1010]